MDIDWKDIELVIFDVDGTLYSQNRLRKIMFFKLLSHYVIRPWKYKELVILYHFRKEREKYRGYSGDNLENKQYEWCAAITNEPIVEVKRVVDWWIFTAPNQYLKSCLYKGVDQFITDLKLKGIKTAIYSDYNSKDKLLAMDIEVNIAVSSTDDHINSFKPVPKGLLYIVSELGITHQEKCVFIGDRVELDGVCAKNAGMPFILISEKAIDNNFYSKLYRTLNASRC